jgi:hypothetical protein
MYQPDIFRHTLSRLVAILQAHSVRFHLTGGITSVAYGEPRMTQDSFIAAAQQAGFLLDAGSVQRAVANRSMFQLFDMSEALKVDLYPRELVPGELDRSTLLEIFAGMQLPVASRPDAAASKLAWAAKGSAKSRRDLRQIVRRMTAVDRAELDRLAALLGLGGLLEEVLIEPDEISG